MTPLASCELPRPAACPAAPRPLLLKEARRRGTMGALGLAALLGLVGTAGLAGSACAPGEVSGENALPSGIPDPATVQTEGGALTFYRRVVATTSDWLDPLALSTGVLTDELADRPLLSFDTEAYTLLDSRTNLNAEALYNSLHRVRAQAREARGFATSYLRDSAASYSKSALQGHLYALEGYAEVFLADLFCSGIPLSTVDYQADYTLTAGFPTAEVYQHAVELFDTALALLGDSVQLQSLAQVGRGRALLAVGDYTGAAAAVAGVADNYQYQVTLVPRGAPRTSLQSAFYGDVGGYAAGGVNVGDGEGINGLPYRTSVDPRVLVDSVGVDVRGYNVYFPVKYPQEGPITYVLAGGMEARVIEAEALLRANPDDGQWLALLNALRTDGTYDTDPNDPAQWHAGRGGVPGLPLLPDPGTAQGRVDLLFRERAFWLYLTGHRQGDLRRLIRQYGREPEAVYPTGPYEGGRGVYGTEVVFPIPTSETQLNPKYTGCLTRGA